MAAVACVSRARATSAGGWGTSTESAGPASSAHLVTGARGQLFSVFMRVVIYLFGG